ncbi:MAG: carbohydrate ABC transporter permease [Armatimonadota bacterium]|nr:carbohydrate ABC transporter permease [Armatimonadota bacterium]MDR7448004.1 carbohydrate ABC transporter permease [Armatimonadota bacterium]MDR7459741.1 carbohydrate ABC transporter permease [Armatimonadota bacterium]MDR7478600.1 carbohydrate ABC transporter permease [Armatimonadota bacterium]MDR7488422.1 carbohydrate ABC transporter permease [Armatimonadota bacterium]
MRRWQSRDARAASVATLRGTGRPAGVAPRRRRRAVRALKRTALYLAALAFTLFAVFPFYWMFLTAFKTNRDLYVGATNLQHIPWIFNEPPTLQHVRLLFLETQYLVWVRNTVLVGALVVLITLLVAVPAGYALARLAGRWGERLGIAIFLTYLIPPTLLFIPFARVIAMLHLQNTLWALVLIYPTFTIPFCTWLLMGFFRAIPRDIEEQGMIDGYSRLAVIRRVMFPLAVSGILTAAMFAFTLVMQEFVYALTFISAVGRMTVSLGVPVALVRGDVFYWGSLMAAALITSIPIAIVYNLFIDRFIQGLTAGAVKG